MCTAGNSEAIIILSDDDDDEDDKDKDLSCLIVDVNEGKTPGNNTFHLTSLLFVQVD